MSDAPIPSTADLLYQDRQNFDMPQFQLQQTPQIQAQFAPQTVFNLPTSNFVPPPTVGPLINNAPPPVATAPQQFQQPFIAPAVSQPWSQPVLPAQFSLRMPVPSYATWTSPRAWLPQMGTDIFGEAPQAPAEQAPAPTIAETASFVPSAEIMAPEAPITERFVAPGLPTAGKLVSPPPSFDGGTANVFKRVEANAYAPPPGWPEGAVVRRDPLAPGGFSVTVPGPKSASMKVYPEDSPALTDVRISPPTEPALPPPADALAATVGTVSADDAMRAVPSTPGGLSAAPKDDPAVRRVEELYTAGVEAAGTPLSDEAKKDLYTRTVDRVKVDEVYKPRLAAVEERLGGLDKEDPSYDVLAKEKERLETRIGAIEEKYKTTVAPVDKEAERAVEFLTDGEKYIAARAGTLTGSDATQWNYYQDKVKDLELWREAEGWSRSKDASEGKDPPTRLASQFRYGQLIKQPELPATETTVVGRIEIERRIFESLHETTRADLLRRPGDLNLDSLVQARQEQQLEPFKLAFGGASDPIMAGGLSDVLDDAGLESLQNADGLLREGKFAAADRAFQQTGRLAIRSQFERAASGKGVIVGGDGSLTVDPRMLSEAQQLQATLGEMFDAAPEGSPARVAIRSQMLRLDRGIDGATGKSEHITGLGLSDFYAKLQADMDVNTPKGATKEYAGHLGEVGETIKERAQLTIKGAIATFERSQGLERDKQTLRETIDGAIDLGRREFKNYVNSTRHGTEFGREGVTRKVRNDGSVEWNTANILAVGNLALLALAPLERAYWQKRQEKREDERYDEEWERQKEAWAIQNRYRLQQIGAAGEASRGGGGSVAGFRPARV